MRKKIPVSELKLGMYIHDLNCPWFKHPFTFNQFIISEQQQLNELRHSNIKEVIIDTDKGVTDMPVRTEDLDVISSIHLKDVADEKIDDSDDNPDIDELDLIEPTSLEQEIQQAKKIKQNAIALIRQLMEDMRLGRQVQLEKFDPLVSEIIVSVFRNQDALLGITRIRNVDKYTYEHSVSVSFIVTIFAKHLGFRGEELKQICLGGLLIDLGKVKTPQSILKKKGKLTEKEFNIVKQHVADGVEMIQEFNIRSDIVNSILLEHHERIDGSGYPNNKQAEEISLFGQMAGIVDTYDACVSEHIYKKGKPPHKVLKSFIAKEGHHFNQDMINQFIHCIGIYPIGTLLGLSNGELAVVTGSTPDGLLYPKVRIFFNSIKRQYITPQNIELTPANDKLKISSVEDPVKWNIAVENFMPHA